jgi:hypothetical protein
LYEHKSAAGAVYRAVLRAEVRDRAARRHALAEIAGAFPQATALNTVDDATSRYLMQESVVPLTSIAGEEARYSTHELLARERELIHGAQRQPRHGRTHDRRKDRRG